MSEKSYKKSPTAFLLNRFSLNKVTQNGTKKRIEKEIVYFRDDTEPNAVGKPYSPTPFEPTPDPRNPELPKLYEGSDFHGNNQGTDKSVDTNSDRINNITGVQMAKTNAKLRIVTPGARDKNAGAVTGADAGFYVAPATRVGLSTSTGLSAASVNTIFGETLQLNQATFIKVNCGKVATLYACINGTPNTYKFLTSEEPYPSADYVTWTDGTNSYFTAKHGFYSEDIIYSNNTLTTAIGHVDACYVEYTHEKDMLAGMFRSIELDTKVEEPSSGETTNYYGWFYFGALADTEFTQVYTTKEKPDVNNPVFIRNIHTGAFVQMPAAFKVAAWSAPATMFDVKYEFDYTPTADEDVLVPTKNEAKLVEANDEAEVIHVKPAGNHYDFNLRALVMGYQYDYPVSQITVTDGQETPITLGTFNFDQIITSGLSRACRWVNTSTTAEQKYVYTWSRDVSANENVYSDTGFKTIYGITSAITLSDTAEEYIGYMSFAAPTGDWTRPDRITLTMTPDYTSSNRRNMVLEEYNGIDITPYIEKKYWNTANLGYGEVSSQTTLYTETAFRYKDLDAHLAQYLPADWEGSAYGCVILADSSATDTLGNEMFFGVSHSDFFADGSDVYYIIPTNTVGGEGKNGPYDLIHSYVYDAALNSIYGTTFAIDTLEGETTTTRHYISDATGNYQKDGAWRYHFACVEDDTKDVWAKRLGFSRSDLYYLDNDEETPLTDQQILVTPTTMAYSNLYDDLTNSENGVCAWYDFAHMDVTSVTGFQFSSTFKPNSIGITPTGGSQVNVTRFAYSDFYDAETTNKWWFAWIDTDRNRYYTDTNRPVTSGAETSATEVKTYDGTFHDYGTVTKVDTTVKRNAWRINGYDTTKTVDDVTTPMYNWEFFDDPTDEGNSPTSSVYTDTLVPTTSTHLWVYEDDTWTDLGVTPSTVTTTPQTWYRYHTSNKETYYIDDEPYERFGVVWATSRNPFDDDVLLVRSNYNANDPALPTSPNLNSSVEFKIRHQCYIAPAYQIVVTYQGEDYIFTADYSVQGFDFQGILYSSWTCDDFKDALYTARITPRVGDKLYVNNGKATAVATDFTIKSVTSVVDFIYPGRA